MAEKHTYICDVCGAEKGGTNHWFIILAWENGHLHITPFTPGEIIKFTYGMIGFHLCGEACVVKKVSGLLAGQQEKGAAV